MNYSSLVLTPCLEVLPVLMLLPLKQLTNFETFREPSGVGWWGNTICHKAFICTRAGIGYPKFGYPRVIPEPESKFGYGLGWVCVQIPWVFLGWVPIKFKILGFFGYYPWVPKSIGYPKLGHLRVIPELYYDKKCSYKYY